MSFLCWSLRRVARRWLVQYFQTATGFLLSFFFFFLPYSVLHVFMPLCVNVNTKKRKRRKKNWLQKIPVFYPSVLSIFFAFTSVLTHASLFPHSSLFFSSLPYFPFSLSLSLHFVTSRMFWHRLRKQRKTLSQRSQNALMYSFNFLTRWEWSRDLVSIGRLDR